MAPSSFPAPGQAPVSPPLVLNWAAESLKAAVETRAEAKHWDKFAPSDLPVLTGKSKCLLLADNSKER
jgi:hypothetical protein